MISLSENNNKKPKDKGYIGKLLESLDFHKVDDENINFKEILKESKNSVSSKEKENISFKKYGGKKDDPLHGRKIIIRKDEKTKDDKEDKKQNTKEIKLNEENEKDNKKENKLNNLLSNIKKINPMFVIIPIVVVIFSVLIFNFINSSDNLNNIKQEFISSIEKEDIDKLQDLVIIDGGNKDFSKESLNNFISLYNKDKEFKNNIDKSLDEDIESFKKDKSFVGKNLIGIIKNNESGFFAKDYKVKITPLKLKDDGILDKKIIIGDKKVKAKDLYLIPGIYEFDYSYEFLKFNSFIEVNYINNSTDYSMVTDYNSLEIKNDKYVLEDGDYKIKIKNAPESAIVFINGKNTGITVKEFNNMDSKNLTDKDSIAVVDKTSIGYALSDSMALINTNGTVNLEVNYNNRIYLEYFIGLIRQTLSEDEQAFKNSDINMITTLGGKTLDNVMGWIKDNIGYGQYYIRDYLSFLLDIDSFEVNISEYNSEAYIGGFLSYKEGKFSKDEEVDEKKMEEHKDKKIGFHFDYDENEKKWTVDWGTTYRNIGTGNSLLIKLK